MTLLKKLFTPVSIALLTIALMAGKVHADDDYSELPNLLDTAITVNTATGEFSTLIAAVLAADPAIIKTLAAKGQRTVFAPTDDAFAALGLNADNVGVALDQATLTAVLKYHVVRGRQDAEDVISSDRLNTLIRGKRGFLHQNGGVLTDNLGRTSNIIATDVMTSNGIIHVIDTVVLPAAP